METRKKGEEITDRELPISDERLKELSAGLSDEAREVLDHLVANQELDPKLRHPPEEFVEDLQALPENDREQLSVIFEELQKGYDRRIKQNEAELEILKRGQRMVDRAKELDPSLAQIFFSRGTRGFNPASSRRAPTRS